MADEYQDPSGNTEAFRAFVHAQEPVPPRRPIGLITAVVVVAVVAAVAILWLALG